MWLQLLTILASIVVYALYSRHYDCNSNRVRKGYIIVVSIFLLLQSGLRSYGVGIDTYTYFLQFEDVKIRSWSTILQGFPDAYLNGEGKDAGYPLFMKIFQIISGNYTAYLLFVAVIFFSTLGKFIYENTYKLRDVLMVVVLYQALFYEFFSITGIRQVVAVSFTLLGFQAIKYRKLFKFIMLMVPAFFLHMSSLVFVPFYFISNINRARLMMIAVLIAFPFLIVYARVVAIIVAIASGSVGYMSYAESDYQTDGAVGFATLLILMIVVSLLLYKKIEDQEPQAYRVYNALSLALVFTPLTWIDPSFMRVVQYFSIFVLIMLPMIINCFARAYGVRSVVFLSCMILLVVYIVIGDEEYRFVWQITPLSDVCR